MSTFYKIVFFLCLCTSAAQATHLLGGEIRASYVSGQTYNISARIYLDAASGAGEAQTKIMLCFGDGNTAEVPRTSYTRLTGDQSGVAVGTFDVTYTYASPGVFQISTNIENRTGNLLNLPNAEFSEMFLWTVINTQVQNTTPVLPIPVFSAGARQVFTIDLKPAIADADSVTAHLQKLCKTSPGTCGVRSINNNYNYPNDVSKKGTFAIDRLNNQLVWNAPDVLGNYIYAFVVDEWRDGIKISETYREGMITVIDKPGPTVEIPAYVPVTGTGIVTSLPDVDAGNLTMLVDAYPVPTEDFLTISVRSAEPTTLRVQVINLDGQVVREIKTVNKETLWSQQVDLRRVTKGMYVIKVTDEQGKMATRKIVR